MTDANPSFVALFVQRFTEIHKIDRRQSYLQLISAFITCISIMEPEDRIKCTSMLAMLLNDISLERFEDGTDFITFMKEKAEEHRINGDFKNDEDVNCQ